MHLRIYSISVSVLLALLTGCQSKSAGPAATGGAASLPIAAGSYVGHDDECANPRAVFRFDGSGMAWIGRGAPVAETYPIRRLRQEQDQWVATIVAPGPGVDGHKTPRELDVFIVPRGAGRITVTAMERVDMKLCPAADLPAWAR